MGSNFDPPSLHKYTYAHNDPVLNVDPTGNFSMGSIGAGISGALTLASIATTSYDVFQIATGEKEFSAREFGTSILLSRLPIRTVTKLVNKFKSKTGLDLRIPCVRNSFVGGTLIHTSNGLRPIEEVAIGDWVLSYNEATGEQEYQEITHLIQHENDYQLVSVEAGDGSVFMSTLDHPFYVEGKWKNADDLQVNDWLTLANGRLAVSEVSKLESPSIVYNFTVANTHTYYIGKAGILVHNVNCVSSVNNMSEFFTTAFGVGVKSASRKTSKIYDGQAIYKVTKDAGPLKTGYHYYLDGRHKDHLEVFDKKGNFVTVINLDGTPNAAKIAAAAGRSIKSILK